jgi:hypothetical protein
VGRRIRQLPTGWLLPQWLEDQTSEPHHIGRRTWTTLGTLASSSRPVVDQRGLVTPRSEGWSLDWWIGADDRWHFPSRDTGVRQRLVEATPVVETSMRIPGGDAVHRVYAVRVSGPPGLEELLVVEIHNQSRVPFALALAIRPYNAIGFAAVQDVDLVGATVTVGGRPALLLPASPPLMAGSTFAQGDSAAAVAGGGATEHGPWPLRCPAGLAQAAFLFPVAHTASVRVAMPMSPDRWRRRRRAERPGEVATLNPSRLPSAADAARAWQAQTRRGLRLDLPAGRLADAVEANRRYLLLWHTPGYQASPASRWPEAALGVVALDRYGFHAEAAEVLAAGGVGWRPAAVGAALWALAEHGRLTGDASQTAVPRRPSAIARRFRRPRPRPPLMGAGLADHRQRCDAGEQLGARVMLRLAAVELEAGDRRALGHLERLLDAASSTWAWPEAVPGGDGHDAVAAVEFCSLVRNLLVREVPGGLSLLTLLPDSWLGQGVEVHDAPTHAGVLSFALRWHGERPALLWQLQPREGLGPVRLTAPGLAISWSTVEPAGDVVLGCRQGMARG